MSSVAPNRAIATPFGGYLVQGLDRFATGGDVDSEVAAAVAEHHQRVGRPPKAVVWDDAVLNFRGHDLSLALLRVDIPVADPFLAARLDSSARVAVAAAEIAEGELQTSDALARLDGLADVARAPALVRMIGWPGAAPLRGAPVRVSSNQARSISVVINYRDRSSTTATSLIALRQQIRRSRLEIILIDNQSRRAERRAVRTVANQLFGADPDAKVIHLAHDEAFNHSAQCNRAVASATGEVLVMLSNDCVLIDPYCLQRMADWAVEPGIGVVGPRLVDGDGLIAGAGMAVGPRATDADEVRLYEAELPYLSQIVRRTNGASFACAAVARETWQRFGGADASAFPIDYNDADFCLRLTEAGLSHIYLGSHRARHSAGLADLRTRERVEELHGVLAERHSLANIPRLNPSALPLRPYPTFDRAHATRICHYVRIYRRALDLRRSGAALDAGLAAAFATLEGVTHEAQGRGMPRPAHFERIDAALRAVCTSFVASQPEADVPDRYRKSAPRLELAFAALRADASRPILPIGLPAEEHAAMLIVEQHKQATEPPAAIPDGKPNERGIETHGAAPDPFFTSHADPVTATTAVRLLVFADTFGPSQRILFVEALGGARRKGELALRLITESDLQNLRSMRGPDGLAEWLAQTVAEFRPTAIIFSRFADHAGYRAIGLATSGLGDVPRLCHIDDDFFTLPAVIGVERYREGRHPRRIHCLTLIAEEADLILASTSLLAERLGSFGVSKVALCPMHEGGEPAPHQPPPDLPVIGYFGSATHNRDLDMIAPALRRLKAERPTLRIEIVGSVARRSAAAALGGLIERRSDIEPDYAAFRAQMRTWHWTVGLAPLMAHPFNAAKTPIKWTEYAAAGIPVIASRTDPYLELGQKGALLLASPDEWYGRIVALLDNPARRADLLEASDRLLRGFQGWARMERRLLGLLDRARDRRIATAAIAA